MSAGNLAITQAVRHYLNHPEQDAPSIWNAATLFDAAQVLGDVVRKVRDRDAEELQKSGIEFNINLIFGGQIKGQKASIFQVYAAGNFIEASVETPYFQIGEAKYGKPILDRVITFDTPLNLATKCALISMDSTLNSNISVGLPLDLMVYEKNSLQASKLVTMDESNPYFQMIHQLWGEKLRSAFNSIAEPSWSGATPSRSIASPAKKMGAVPIHRSSKAVKKATTPVKTAAKASPTKKVDSKAKR